MLGWRTHGPGSGVERAGGGRQHEGFRACGGGVLRKRFGERRSHALAEQGADVTATKGEVSGTQAARIRCAQGREQKEQAGEMTVAETHVFLILNEMRVELDAGVRFGVDGLV